jgi:hypothetical protein
MQASVDPITLKIEVQTPLGRIAGTALPLNVGGGAVADEVLLPAPMPLLDDTWLVGRGEPLKVIVVGPSSVITEVRVLVL